MKQGHTISFWHKEGDKAVYMDKDGRVFEVKENTTTVKATGWKPEPTNKRDPWDDWTPGEPYTDISHIYTPWYKKKTTFFEKLKKLFRR